MDDAVEFCLYCNGEIPVHFLKNEETEINIRGRHDPAIIRRICPVIDAVAALAVADLLQQKYGADVMTKGIGK